LINDLIGAKLFCDAVQVNIRLLIASSLQTVIYGYDWLRLCIQEWKCVWNLNVH